MCRRWKAQIWNQTTKKLENIGDFLNPTEAAEGYGECGGSVRGMEGTDRHFRLTDAVARQRGKPTNLEPYTYGKAVKKTSSSKYKGVSWQSELRK